MFAGETVRCTATVRRGRRRPRPGRAPPDHRVLAVEVRPATAAPSALLRDGPAGHGRRAGRAVSTACAIVGAAECDLGSHREVDRSTLQTQAVTRALADAGLTLADVDGLATTAVVPLLHHTARRVSRASAPLGRLDVRRRVGRSRCSSPAPRRRSTAGQASVVVISLRVEPALRALAQPRRDRRGAHPGGAVRGAVRPAVPAVVLRDGGAAVPAPVRRHAASSWPRSRSPPGSGRCSTRPRSATAPGR